MHLPPFYEVKKLVGEVAWARSLTWKAVYLGLVGLL